MIDYLVSWEIDIAADTPEEAARLALEIQRRPGSSAVCFDVSDGTTKRYIDLDNGDNNYAC